MPARPAHPPLPWLYIQLHAVCAAHFIKLHLSLGTSVSAQFAEHCQQMQPKMLVTLAAIKDKGAQAFDHDYENARQTITDILQRRFRSSDRQIQDRGNDSPVCAVHVAGGGRGDRSVGHASGKSRVGGKSHGGVGAGAVEA